MVCEKRALRSPGNPYLDSLLIQYVTAMLASWVPYVLQHSLFTWDGSEHHLHLWNVPTIHTKLCFSRAWRDKLCRAHRSTIAGANGTVLLRCSLSQNECEVTQQVRHYCTHLHLCKIATDAITGWMSKG